MLDDSKYRRLNLMSMISLTNNCWFSVSSFHSLIFFPTIGLCVQALIITSLCFNSFCNCNLLPSLDSNSTPPISLVDTFLLDRHFFLGFFLRLLIFLFVLLLELLILLPFLRMNFNIIRGY